MRPDKEKYVCGRGRAGKHKRLIVLLQNTSWMEANLSEINVTVAELGGGLQM